MSYSNMSGLDLFQTPFHRSQSTKPQASGQQANRQKPGAADLQPKTEEAPTAQQPKPVASSAQRKSPEKSAVPSDQTDTASRTDLQTKQPVSEPKAPSLQTGAAVPEEAISAQQEETAHEATDKNPEQHQDEAQADPKSNDSADTKKQPEPQKELVLDMSASTADSKPLTADDQEKRKAHEAAEEAELQKLQNMTDDEAVAASIERVKTDVERLTRRNMKECVAEHIQELCRKDPVFAKLTLRSRKTMISCFRYINSEAQKYAEQEMRENGIKPENGMYGTDVPDQLCYQWAEDYFLNPDQENEQKFVPKPYTGAASKPKKSASKSKKSDKPAKKESKEKQETAENGYEQMTLEV